MVAKHERRFVKASEFRIDGAAGARKLIGHAAVFNALSEDLGGFREKIAPGAFAASIAADDIRALFNHDPNFVLGRNVAGTLKLAEDETGLAMSCDLPDTQAARDLVVSIERGDITGQSFSFNTISDEWNMVEGDTVRTLLAVRLWDVSPVTFPAYPQTDAAMRGLEAWRASTAEAVRLAAKPPAHLSIAAMRRRLDLESLD